MTGVTERLRERAGDHHVAPLHHWRARGHDGNAAHGTSVGFTRTPRNRVSLSAPLKIGTKPVLLETETTQTYARAWYQNPRSRVKAICCVSFRLTCCVRPLTVA